MYAPAGFGLPELGDIEVVPHGDELHLFHLTLPNHDIVHHAVSTDGLAWRPLPAALRTGDPGACDDDMIWTMAVSRLAGGWGMLYTAIATADRGLVQRTALATSPDLVHWTKAPDNPVAAADPRWYEADPSQTGAVSWRDPKPVRVGETWFATICARQNEGPLLRRGCVGLLASEDFRRWEVRPPLFAPLGFWDLECPQAFRLGGNGPAGANGGPGTNGEQGPWFLTAAIMEDRLQRYWRAESFAGPYETPVDGGLLAPVGHYAAMVSHWRGMDLLWCWHQPQLPRGWMTSLATLDWLPAHNPFGKHLVAPLVLRERADGTLGRHSFPGWLAYRDGDLRPAIAATPTRHRGEPVAPDHPWLVDGAAGGVDIVATETPAGDLWLEATLAFECRVGGVAFRLDDEGSGYFIGLRIGSKTVLLQKWILETHPRDGSRFARHEELQRGELRRPVAAGDRLRLHLILNGPAIECSIDGEVVLSELSGERLGGCFGLWADTGTLHADDLRWAPMRRIEHGRGTG